jgi:hypothetical protein
MLYDFEPFAKLDPLGHEMDPRSGSRFVADIDSGKAFVVPGVAAIEGEIEPDILPGTQIAQIERITPIALELNGGVKLIEKRDVADASQAFERRVAVHVEDNLEGAFRQVLEVVGISEQEFAQALTCKLGLEFSQIYELQSGLQRCGGGRAAWGGHIHSSGRMDGGQVWLGTWRGRFSTALKR